MTTTGPGPDRRHRIDVADHFDGGDEPIDLCDAAVTELGPHSITHISSGVRDFTVDAFDEPYLAARIPDVDPAALRAACQSVARLLTSAAATQDEKLDEVRTGRLIRTVLHGDGGAIFCFSVVPGEYLVGFTLEPVPIPAVELTRMPAVNAADAAMSALADRFRARVGLRSQNPGGRLGHDHAADPPASTISPHVEGAQDRPDLELIRAAVSPADLHFLCYQAAYRAELAVDYLEHPLTRRFFMLISIEARRKFYSDLARELPKTAGQLGRLVRSSVGGSLRRLVLDVEQGAIYCYRLDAGNYLIGLTLDQEQVSVADAKLARLTKALT